MYQLDFPYLPEAAQVQLAGEPLGAAGVGVKQSG